MIVTKMYKSKNIGMLEFHEAFCIANKIYFPYSRGIHHSNLLLDSKKDFNSKETILNAMKEFRGTVAEVVMRRLPAKEAKSLADWFGFVSNNSNISKIENKQPHTIHIEDKKDKIRHVDTSHLLVDHHKVSQILSQSAATADHNLLHPIFGEFLHDLKYKRMYLTNVQALMQAPIWEKQRILRPERAARIANAKSSKTKTIPGLPGTITMFHDITTDRCGIVDGQHRAAALMIMAQEGHWDPLERNIALDVFPVTSEQDISHLFHEINSAEPVRLVDMPGEVLHFLLILSLYPSTPL